MGDNTHNTLKYLEFSPRELLALLITSFFGAFVLSLRIIDFGVSALMNYLFVFLSFFVLLFVHVSAQKLFGVKQGYKVVFKEHVVALIVGVFIGLFSYGYVPFFVTGVLSFSLIKRLRTWRFHPGFKNWELSAISLAGSLTSLLLLLPLKLLWISTKLPVFENLLMVNIFIMLFSFLPIPLLTTLKIWRSFKTLGPATAGFNIFFHSRPIYVFCLLFALFFTVLSLLFNFYSFLISLILASAVTYVYHKVVENA